MSEQCCANCRFGASRYEWENTPCRRHAPATEKVESWQDLRGFVPRWPIMKAHDWCGDWEAGAALARESSLREHSSLSEQIQEK